MSTQKENLEPGQRAEVDRIEACRKQCCDLRSDLALAQEQWPKLDTDAKDAALSKLIQLVLMQ